MVASTRPRRKLQIQELSRQLLTGIIIIALRGAGIFIQVLSLKIISGEIGATGLGIVIYAQAIVLIVGTLVDFGYLVTATPRVVKHRNSIYILGKIYWAIQLPRLFLMSVASALLVGISNSLLEPAYRESVMTGILSLLGLLLTPQWIIQGLGKIAQLNALLILPKVLSLALLSIPAFHPLTPERCSTIIFGMDLLGGIIASALCFNMIGLTQPRFNHRFSIIITRRSLDAWLSNMAFAVIGYSAPIIIKETLGPMLVGALGAADKIIKSLHTLTSSAIQGMYYYSCKRWQSSSRSGHNYAIQAGITTVGCVTLTMLAVIIFSREIVIFTFQPKMSIAILPLQCMSFFLPIAAANATMCYLNFYPRGDSKSPRRIFTSAAAIAPAVTYVLSSRTGVVGASLAPVVTELAITFALIFALKKTNANLTKLKNVSQSKP